MVNKKLVSMFNAPRSRAKFSRPANAANTDNMDDFNVVKAIDVTEGKIQDTPTEDKHIVNKEYVDSLVGGTVDFFLYDNASGDVGGYSQIRPFPSSEAKSSLSASITADATLIKAFVTPLDCNCAGVLGTLRAGVYSLHIHSARTVGVQDVRLYWELYTRVAGGTETLRGTSGEGGLLGSSEGHDEIYMSLTDDIDLASDDRIVIKVYGNVEGAGSTPTATIYMEGTTTSRVILSASVPAGHNITSDAVIVDNTIVRGDGGDRKVQSSTPTISDAGTISGSNLEMTGTISGANLINTADNTISGVAYVANTIFGTDATPPAASGFTKGSVYVQYTP